LLKGRFAPTDAIRNECAGFAEGFANDQIRGGVMRRRSAESFAQRLPRGTYCRLAEKLAGPLGTIFPLSKT
jgi:hypothetical protein